MSASRQGSISPHLAGSETSWAIPPCRLGKFPLDFPHHQKGATLSLNELLTTHQVTQAELMAALRLSAPGLSRKLSGARQWKVAEAIDLLAFLRKRCAEPSLELADLFPRPKRKRAA